MQIAQLRSQLTNDKFFIVYPEFQQMCDFQHEAVAMLSKFFYWADNVENNPRRDGWFYKTATDLFNELGLTRRGYEKARQTLLNLGVIQFKKCGVFNKMHFRIVKEKLFEQICKVKGISTFNLDDAYQLDTDGYRVSKNINIVLWNTFIQSRKQATGRTQAKAYKNKCLQKLKSFHDQGLDVDHIMQKAIDNGWAGFYYDNNSGKNSHSNPKKSITELISENTSQPKSIKKTSSNAAKSAMNQLKSILKK
jgi:hypothetical protein